MYLWRRLADRTWWANHEPVVTSMANIAVIAKPNRKRLQIECASESLRELRELEKQFGGRVSKLPRDWLNRALRQKTAPIRIGGTELIIPAGAAFGTGEHATTAMCLRMLERVMVHGRDGSPSGPKYGDASEKRPYHVVDLGTGSGILALSARLLGAAKVMAVDNDPIAIRTAKQNARQNNIRGVQFKVGDVRQLQLPIDVDIVLANLFVDLLIEILPRIRDARWLILSGVLRDQEAALVRALKRNGIGIQNVRRRGKWIAVLAQQLRRS